VQLTKRWLSIAGLSALFACEESLPPRIDPSSLLPSDFLETTFRFAEGNVVFFRDTFPAAGGVFWITAKNLHDEVLQARADIQLDIDYSLTNRAAPMQHVHGDSNNLINRYNFNGDYFMHQKGLLTIEPESTATFIILMDHKGDQWWDLGNPSVIPGNNGGVFTDQLEFSASGALSLFKGYDPIPLDKITGAFLYQFLGAESPLYAGSLTIRLNDQGLVELEWINLLIQFQPEFGFKVQKSPSEEHNQYEDISNGLVPPAPPPPLPDTTTHYAFTDFGTVPGTWYYRLAQVEITGPCNSVIAITAYSDGLRIDVP